MVEPVRGLVTVRESAGRCDPGSLLLHDEPDGEGSEYADTG